MSEKQFGDPTDEEDEDVIDVGGLDDIDSKYLVPNGHWEVETVSSEKTLSKTSGNPMVVLEIRLTGEHKNNDGVLVTHEEADKHRGKVFTAYISLAAAALFKVKQVAEALDLPMEGGRLRAKLSQFVDKQMVVEMKADVYEGRETSKVGNMYRHPEGPEL